MCWLSERSNSLKTSRFFFLFLLTATDPDVLIDFVIKFTLTSLLSRYKAWKLEGEKRWKGGEKAQGKMSTISPLTTGSVKGSEAAAAHKASRITMKTDGRQKKKGRMSCFLFQRWIFPQLGVVSLCKFYCISNIVFVEDNINRCCFIIRTKGLVSRGWVVFNGLIRDQPKLRKIIDLQRLCRTK